MGRKGACQQRGSPQVWHPGSCAGSSGPAGGVPHIPHTSTSGLTDLHANAAAHAPPCRSPGPAPAVPLPGGHAAAAGRLPLPSASINRSVSRRASRSASMRRLASRTASRRALPHDARFGGESGGGASDDVTFDESGSVGGGGVGFGGGGGFSFGGGFMPRTASRVRRAASRRVSVAGAAPFGDEDGRRAASRRVSVAGATPCGNEGGRRASSRRVSIAGTGLCSGEDDGQAEAASLAGGASRCVRIAVASGEGDARPSGSPPADRGEGSSGGADGSRLAGGAGADAGDSRKAHNIAVGGVGQFGLRCISDRQAAGAVAAHGIAGSELDATNEAAGAASAAPGAPTLGPPQANRAGQINALSARRLVGGDGGDGDSAGGGRAAALGDQQAADAQQSDDDYETVSDTEATALPLAPVESTSVKTTTSASGTPLPPPRLQAPASQG
eukprot:350510-Chlamydomonas_euryale.AAC.1